MGIITVKNFAKSFGDKVVHTDVSFDVKKGECLALIGGSGAGKSVILRGIIGLEMPDSGSIKVNGEEITTLKEDELVNIRKKVAYAFQGGALFDSMSVFDNLAYPLREHTKLNKHEISEKIFKTLGMFGLEESAKLLPSELSGGMQKRLGLARAMILEPEVILYDEPTAGLDPFNILKIRKMILQLKKFGITSILVTHDIPTVFAVCDRIAMLHGGKIGDIGTKEEFKNKENSMIKQFTEGEICYE